MHVLVPFHVPKKPTHVD